ncbi:MAG: STAS domain-containing protein [Actinomycetota bacterium]|nr:STAS domain-containing protein [Actinomycetota bacterium]
MAMDDVEDALAPQLEVVVEARPDGTRVIALNGELDVGTVPPFAAALQDALADSAPRLLVDLAEVTFIDSTALMTLLTTLRELHRRGGQLVLACQNPTVLRLFEVTRTQETFAIFPTREQAQGHLDAAA